MDPGHNEEEVMDVRTALEIHREARHDKGVPVRLSRLRAARTILDPLGLWAELEGLDLGPWQAPSVLDLDRRLHLGNGWNAVPGHHQSLDVQSEPGRLYMSKYNHLKSGAPLRDAWRFLDRGGWYLLAPGEEVTPYNAWRRGAPHLRVPPCRRNQVQTAFGSLRPGAPAARFIVDPVVNFEQAVEQALDRRYRMDVEAFVSANARHVPDDVVAEIRARNPDPVGWLVSTFDLDLADYIVDRVKSYI